MAKYNKTEDEFSRQIKPIVATAETPTIYNVTMTTADTQYSQALSAGVQKFIIHTRDGTAYRFAYVTGKVATPTAPYFSMPANSIYSEDLISGDAKTLYFACASDAKVIEIIEWV